jgi:hypothetical protein
MNGPPLKPKGISLNTPGFPDTQQSEVPGLGLGLTLNGPDVPKTFQTRKAQAMRKKGLIVKGNSFGSKLNSLANLVKHRKEQAQKNDLKNSQKNKKKTLKERKMEAILKKVKQNKEHDNALLELRKMEAKEDPEFIFSREKKRKSNKIKPTR